MIEGKFIQTNQIQTHYWEMGSGEPLILLHGGGAGADGWGNWEKSLELYAEKGFRTIAIDTVGFGQSDKPSPEEFKYDHDARVDQLLSLISALELEKASVVGNSMGGLTSLGAAIKDPDKIDKIILMGTGKPKKESNGMKALINYKIDYDAMHTIVSHLTNPNFEVDSELVNYRLNLTKQQGALESYGAIMQGILSYEFEQEHLKNIKHKTLLVHGTLDNMVPLQRSYELLDTLPNAWLYVMPHCGHWAMMEYPEEFVRVTSDFLRNH
ncbi:alpha/beta fold hydrolase [Neobacillus sp. NPDC097160]|uniref:alpha/beta fold hydrolase n=1 Tax=Neobacillus sp. NPDC097160 TaxID=3364298 RepID=UPI00380ACD18